MIAFADIHDRIGIEPADSLSLTLDGPFAPALNKDPNNLVLRAATALADQAGLQPRASITLSKHLPVASGIGGGSADAAATLRALNIFWQVGMDESALSLLGQSLGADVPVCLFGRTARVQGIGEHVVPGPDLPDVGVVLVNPGVGLSTAAVFSERQAAFSKAADLPGSFETASSLIEFLSMCHNDLLPPARRLSPEIDTVLAEISRIPGCRLASMSGSGATCFGIFADRAAARTAASVLQGGQPDWWIHAGRFLAMTPRPGENL